MRIALFDLDHTLLPHDTQALFCNHVIKRAPWRLVLHVFFLSFALARALRLCSTETAKRAFHSYLWGMPAKRLRQLAAEFARDSVDGWMYPELRAELLRHRHQGRVTVLNTASPAFYARAIAEHWGFDHWIATGIDPAGRMPLLPRIDGANNKRGVKIATMLERLPALRNQSAADKAESWGYSDSAADIPLLEFCGHKVLIHPGARLAAHFRGDAGAVALKPARPYGGRLGNLVSMARQVAGLYPDRPRS
jgi:HAD superfamily hydrolase (TIGR01490 family)